ncbi:hypothetical protein GCM10023220_68570 [Streptomyces ziwulingensis]|uniref:PknH-like extracellular domain-containing protein n=1 Tax=Streptomyces ziwulingensis TaxID=1045501 RepID=A0ABP9D580_9ACTN
MDAAGNMALSAVQVLTAVATGAGTEAGRALGDVIRARLGTSDEGRAALARVNVAPADPAAALGLQEAIREAIAADPEFQDRVAAALAGPSVAAPPVNTISHSYRDSIVIGASSKVRRSQISLGPLTINNTRSARASLTAAAALLLTLLALAAYGGAQVIAGPDSPGASSGNSPRSPRAASSGPSSAPSPSGGASVQVVRDAVLAKQILPGPESLPDAWTFASGSPQKDTCRNDRVGTEKDGTLHYICKDSLLSWTAWYDPGEAAGFDKVRIEVVTYSSLDAAAEGYLGMKAEEANNPPSGVTQETLSSYGWESALFSVAYPGISAVDGVDRAQARSVVRCGTVMFSVYVMNEHGSEVDLDTLNALSKTVVTRAQQALLGEPPNIAVGRS